MMLYSVFLASEVFINQQSHLKSLKKTEKILKKTKNKEEFPYIFRFIFAEKNVCNRL